MPSHQIVEALVVLLNGGILLGILKLVRQFSQLEFKVEMMWKVFSRRFGTRDGDEEGLARE